MKLGKVKTKLKGWFELKGDFSRVETKRALHIIHYLYVIITALNFMTITSHRAIQVELDASFFQFIITIASAISLINIFIKNIKIRKIEIYSLVFIVILIPLILITNIKIFIILDELVITFLWVLVGNIDGFIYNRYLKSKISSREYGAVVSARISLTVLISGLISSYMFKVINFDINMHLWLVKIVLLISLLFVMIIILGH